MSSGTGLDSYIGFAAESTWATPVTPTRFPGFDSESFAGARPTAQDSGLRANQRVARSAGRKIIRREAAGGFTATLMDSGFGMFFRQAAGSSTIALTAGQTAAWTQVHTIGSLLGKSLTAQKVAEQTDGTDQPFTYGGYKVTSLDVSMDTSGYAKVAIDGVAQHERTLATSPASLAVASPSYSTAARPFALEDVALTLGGSAIAGVKSLNVKLTNALTSLEQRTYLGGSGFGAEPLRNGLVVIDGQMTVDWIDRTALFDHYNNDDPLALVWTFTGSPIVGSVGPINSSLVINVPVIKLNGETPKITGSDILNMTVPFEGLYDDTNTPITYTITSGDNAF